MQLYLNILRLFWATTASRRHKIKAILWLIRYPRWIKKLYMQLQRAGLDYVFVAYPALPFTFRMKAYVVNGSSNDFILNRLVGHYKILHQNFGKDGVAAIHTDGLSLGTIYISERKIQVILHYMSCMSQEGQLSVKVLLDDQIFYYAHVHFYEKSLWIGGFQGCPNQMENYKKFTKEFMGLRPHNFMYLILTALAKRLDLDEIYAISAEHHYYQKKKRTMQQVQFKYNEFWTELGGEMMPDHIWFRTPSAYPRKKISDIVSKKRSQYHQRYAIIDQVMSGF